MAVLEKARKDGGIPGMSVAILHKGELVFAQGFGKRNRNDPFTTETVSHIASVSKAFTATAVGELVAEGKVDWDTTPVSHYLPEFQLKDPVLTSQLTFADVLSHRTPVPLIDFAWFRNEQSRRELIKQLRYLDMPSQMSPFVNYNNIIYAVAGEAAANVAGMSYSELIKAKLLNPLGLKDAGLSLPEMAKRPNYAMPYYATSFENARNGIYDEGYMDPIPMADAPAGDIYMNVLDLAKWGGVIMNEGELNGKQVLNKANVQETLKPHNIAFAEERRPDFAPTTGYGLGWQLDSYKGHTVMYHGGGNPGYRSNLAFFPDDDLVVSFLSNVGNTDLPTSLPYYIADGILNLTQTTDWLNDTVIKKTKYIYDAYTKWEYSNIPERIENKPCSHALVDYAGEYTHPVFGKIVVTLQEDGSLFMKDRTLESRLEQHHFESFKGYVKDFAIRGSVFLTFNTGSNGRVDSVEVAPPMSSETNVFKKTEMHKLFFENLPTVLEKARKDGGIPGMSIAILHKGELVFAQGFGKRNRHDPYTTETVSHIASLTKAFTAAAIGELVAEGKLDWDTTPVSQYLPEFQLKDPILTSQLTFADLLSHRTPFPYIDIAWVRNERAPRELIKQLRHLDMPSKLPRDVNYNNVMYAVAGEAAANVAGLTYPELIKAKIFDPLGLKDAGLSQPEMAKRPNYAMPYYAASFDDAKNGTHEEGYIDPIPMSVAPAGDIFINVLDLVKWGRVILKEGEQDGKQVLNMESVQETLKAHNIVSGDREPGFAPTFGYGFGWGLNSYKGHTIMTHAGVNPGYKSMLAFLPNDDLVVAFLSNVETTELPSSILYYVADELFNLPKTEDWINDVAIKRTQETYEFRGGIEKIDFPKYIEGTTKSHPLVDYAGEYEHPVFERIVITLQEDGSLFMKVRTLETKLEHYHYDSFKGYVKDFSLRGNVFFTFFTNSNGRVDSVEATLVLGSGPEMYKRLETPR
ncbi:hypothetical protein BGZ96_007073 [Linnemannia gamsii]|uniref:Beta-lactamase/transpeptidase-like protein n=1 Tax=Linnemannia gamsii TaxID=64522 RepID=A0ABQ7K195_9FUNG|nr:hypothetical protein BGZ96_007073 [Linnemannia gamsii]